MKRRWAMPSVTLNIEGMTCLSCEKRIEKALRGKKGITGANVSFTSGTAKITFNERLISLEKIIDTIQQLGYWVAKEPPKPAIARVIGIAAAMIVLYLVLNLLGVFNIFNAFPQAGETTGYGMLFVIGLLTSLHCVAMCGGINLSQSVPQSIGNSVKSPLIPSLLYNAGRVVSYTLVGGIVGAAGSVISFSGAMKGAVQIAAGIFMVIMGLNMLNLFPALKKLTPRIPNFFASEISRGRHSKAPFVVGLLNGLMPCGPLQAMQLYALSTGSLIKGAISMLIFSLGTVPLMFGLGALSSYLSRKFTHKMMAVCAVLVVFLGFSMLGSGLSLSGLSLPGLSGTGSPNQNIAEIDGNLQTVTTKLHPGRYEPITVQKGIPVKWIIKADKKDINGCNNEIYIPKFSISKKLEEGENIIEFTPEISGTFEYTCWMGMIRSQIVVVDDIKNF
ncbi:MAG TPA: heavy metal transporter [Clostridiales bacterium]|nr:heavy metal transporter [Clostridiales bacterium]